MFCQLIDSHNNSYIQTGGFKTMSCTIVASCLRGFIDKMCQPQGNSSFEGSNRVLVLMSGWDRVKCSLPCYKTVYTARRQSLQQYQWKQKEFHPTLHKSDIQLVLPMGRVQLPNSRSLEMRNTQIQDPWKKIRTFE